MGGEHRGRYQAAKQTERVEQFPQAAALVENAQVVVDTEWNALQQIAERHAEYDARNEAAGEQRVIPERAPPRIGDLVAEIEAHRPQDQRGEHQKHGDIETGERRRVDRGPRRKYRAAAENEPHLIAFPERSDGVDRHPPLGVGARHERQQHRCPEIEAVHDGKADQQHPEEEPPDDPQRFVIERN